MCAVGGLEAGLGAEVGRLQLQLYALGTLQGGRLATPHRRTHGALRGRLLLFVLFPPTAHRKSDGHFQFMTE